MIGEQNKRPPDELRRFRALPRGADRAMDGSLVRGFYPGDGDDQGGDQPRGNLERMRPGFAAARRLMLAQEREQQTPAGSGIRGRARRGNRRPPLDLTRIDRLEAAYARRGERLLARLFTAGVEGVVRVWDLAELAPDWWHPVLSRSARQLLEALPAASRREVRGRVVPDWATAGDGDGRPV